MPHLLFGELGDAFCDLALCELEARDGEGQEVCGDSLHAGILRSWAGRNDDESTETLVLFEIGKTHDPGPEGILLLSIVA
jgi:hypothetical protein